MLEGFVMLTFQLVCFGEETCTLIFKGPRLRSSLFHLKSTFNLIFEIFSSGYLDRH